MARITVKLLLVLPAATPPLGVVAVAPDVVPGLLVGVVVELPKFTLPPELAGLIVTEDMMTLPVGQVAVNSAGPAAKPAGMVKLVANVPLALVVVVPRIICVVGLLKVNETLPPAVVPHTPVTVKFPPMVGVRSLIATLALGSIIPVLKVTAPVGQLATIATGPPPALDGTVKVELKLPFDPVVLVEPKIITLPERTRFTETLPPPAVVPQLPLMARPWPKIGLPFRVSVEPVGVITRFGTGIVPLTVNVPVKVLPFGHVAVTAVWPEAKFGCTRTLAEKSPLKFAATFALCALDPLLNSMATTPLLPALPQDPEIVTDCPVVTVPGLVLTVPITAALAIAANTNTTRDARDIDVMIFFIISSLSVY